MANKLAGEKKFNLTSRQKSVSKKYTEIPSYAVRMAVI